MQEKADKECACNVLKSYGHNVNLNDGLDGIDDESDDDASEDEEEGEDGYRPGGYHPVNIGDRFNNNRYIVVEKLGWGHFSTVWMCYDRKKSTPDDPFFVAMKVQKSANHYRDAALDEVELLRNVSDAIVSSRAIKEYGNSSYDPHIINLYDHFEHVGPHGKHVCMVFEMLGENLLKIIKKYDYRGIPIDIVKNFTRQICRALDFMHRHCQIIHTDLKPENILIGIAPRPADLEKVAALVAGAVPVTSPSNKNGHKVQKKKKTGPTAVADKDREKEKDAVLAEVVDGMEKMALQSDMTAEQRKKLKKRLKKKRSLQNKKDTKKIQGKRKARSKLSPVKRNLESSIEKTQANIEMLLMERDSVRISEAGLSSAVLTLGKGLKQENEFDEDQVDLKSEDEAVGDLTQTSPKSAVKSATVSGVITKEIPQQQHRQRHVEDVLQDQTDIGVCKILRPSVFMHSNFDARRDSFVDFQQMVKDVPTLSCKYDQVETIPKSSFLAPQDIFAASIPLVCCRTSCQFSFF
jgi:hypothetical protein